MNAYFAYLDTKYKCLINITTFWTFVLLYIYIYIYIHIHTQIYTNTKFSSAHCSVLSEIKMQTQNPKRLIWKDFVVDAIALKVIIPSEVQIITEKVALIKLGTVNKVISKSALLAVH